MILGILFQLFILVVLIYIIKILLYSMLKGAPYAPLGNKRIKSMFDLLGVKKGENLVDLGSGDGRIVIYAAKLGYIAIGLEINPILFLLSSFNIKKSKSKGKIFLKDYWKVDFSEYKNVTLYGAPPIMSSLEKKLQKELKKGSKVVSNHFKFPNWKPNKNFNDVYLYIKN